jgi:hypothetical protein
MVLRVLIGSTFHPFRLRTLELHGKSSPHRRRLRLLLVLLQVVLPLLHLQSRTMYLPFPFKRPTRRIKIVKRCNNRFQLVVLARTQNSSYRPYNWQWQRFERYERKGHEKMTVYCCTIIVIQNLTSLMLPYSLFLFVDGSTCRFTTRIILHVRR